MKQSKFNFNFAFLLIVFQTISATLPNDPIVEIQQGFVRGTKMVSTSGREFAAFRGIPYAKPPVDQLRFKPPEGAEKWDGVFNATADSPMCAQFNLWTDNVTYEEDCLTLNVYTPKLTGEQRLPVLVYIHEGAFASGEASSTNKPPQRWMNKDLVLVLMQYRLGPLGFLSTGDEALPGNFGMLDQVQALKWVQSNIEPFMGDPTRVTLLGQSAGAASVTYHVISPLSRGLFRNAIAVSGTALDPWAFEKNPRPWAERIGQEVNCNTTSSTILVECLRTKPASEIIDAAIHLQAYDIDIIPFKPVIDKDFGGNFLPDSPENLYKEGILNKVPVVIGTTRDEAAGLFYGNVSDFDVIDDEFFEERLPIRLKAWTKFQGDLRNLSYAVKELYFDVIDVSNRSQVIRTVIDLVSDIAYKAATVLTVKLLAGHDVPVYMYSFEYAGNVSQTDFTGRKEVIHEDDLYYIFNRTVLNEEDERMSNTILEMANSFVYNLTPNPNDRAQWIPTNAQEPLAYLYIGDDVVEMKQGYLTERMNFWNEIAPTIVHQ